MHRTIDSSYGSNVTIVQSDVFIVHVVFLLDILIQLLVCSSRRLQDTTTLVRGWRCVPAGSPQGVVCFKSPSPLKAAPVFVWGRTAICSRPHPCSCWSFLVLLWRMAVSTLSVGTTVCNITSFMWDIPCLVCRLKVLRVATDEGYIAEPVGPASSSSSPMQENVHIIKAGAFLQSWPGIYWGLSTAASMLEIMTEKLCGRKWYLVGIIKVHQGYSFMLIDHNIFYAMYLSSVATPNSTD